MSIGEADYKLMNSKIDKDLGVTFDCKNFNQHLYEIRNKAAIGYTKENVTIFR